jgi:hypothetical protein
MPPRHRTRRRNGGTTGLDAPPGLDKECRACRRTVLRMLAELSARTRKLARLAVAPLLTPRFGVWRRHRARQPPRTLPWHRHSWIVGLGSLGGLGGHVRRWRNRAAQVDNALCSRVPSCARPQGCFGYPAHPHLSHLRFFADRAAKKWRLRGSLKYAGVLLAYPP